MTTQKMLAARCRWWIFFYRRSFDPGNFDAGRCSAQIVRFTNKNKTFAKHSERIISSVFTWNGPFNIVKIEILDQNATGAIVDDIFVFFTSIIILLERIFDNSEIDFIINIYAENLRSNDIFYGNLTENSVLLHT